MKIRIIAILFTLVMLIGGLVLWLKIDKKEAQPLDMLALNTMRDEIENKLLEGSDVAALES